MPRCHAGKPGAGNAESRSPEPRVRRPQPAAWSLEPGAWSLEPGAWSLEPGAGSRDRCRVRVRVRVRDCLESDHHASIQGRRSSSCVHASRGCWCSIQ
ncbi:hypothetical protein F1599_03735 [Cupriavidus cauae]|uniref:Uncharacterized protein n=1 Tax=Cupriavidus cauae TaxID=2608999 RepID=A0A5M8B4P4_9BURK|nr:hypothetical protein F1599_03735 [Cupriavidus cauae]